MVKLGDFVVVNFYEDFNPLLKKSIRYALSIFHNKSDPGIIAGTNSVIRFLFCDSLSAAPGTLYLINCYTFNTGYYEIVPFKILFSDLFSDCHTNMFLNFL